MSTATVDTAEFRDALAWVAKCVPARPTALVLAGLRIRFEDDTGDQGPGVRLSAFDYEVSHSAFVPASTTVAPAAAEVLVPGLRARDLVASMKADVLELSLPATTGTTTGTGLVLKAGRTTVTLPRLPLGEYPSLPGRPATVGLVHADDLVDLCRTTWHACGRSDMLPVLMSVHLVGDRSIGPNRQVRAETTDRFRVSRRTVGWTPVPADVGLDVLVPGRELGTAAAGLTGTVEVGADDKTIRLTTTAREVIIRLNDGEFPKLAGLYPQPDAYPVSVETDVVELVDALKRAHLAREGKESCLLRVTADSIGIDTADTGAGLFADDLVDATVDGITGDDFEQGFDPVLLADAIASIDTTTVRIAFKTGKPALVRAGHDDTDALVMPRRRA